MNNKFYPTLYWMGRHYRLKKANIFIRIITLFKVPLQIKSDCYNFTCKEFRGNWYIIKGHP